MSTPPLPLAKPLMSALLSGLSTGLGYLASQAESARLATRFLRGRVEFQPRPEDIWVVTYPRSGTTWVQFMLYQLTTDGDLDFTHLTDVSPWFERSLAIGTHRAAQFEAVPSPRVFKSHLTPGWLPSTGRVVCVERAPEDVAVSYFHFYRSHLRYPGTFDEFFERFLRGDVQYGAWADHVGEWREASHRRDVLTLTYEGLRRDPVGHLDRLCAFLDLHPSPEARTRALQRSRFSFMKEHEEKFDHITALLQERGLRPSSFLRSGTVGEGAAQLSPPQRAQLQAAERRGPRRRGHRTDLSAFLR